MAISNWIAGLRNYQSQAVKIFVLTAFFVHIWTILNILFDVPSLILYMNLGELLAALSYPLFFALIESVLIAFPLVLLGAVLPEKWRNTYYFPFVFVMLLSAALTTVVFHIFPDLWSDKKWIILAGFGFAALFNGLLWRFPRLRSGMVFVADRLAVLTYIYLVFDVLAVLLVIVRNVR